MTKRLPLVCPRCRSPLDIAMDEIACVACGASYASPFGVPVLVEGAFVERVGPPADALVADVAAALGARDRIEEIKHCFSLRVQMPDPALQVEAEQFAHRLSASGHAISNLPQARQDGERFVNVPDGIRVRLSPLVFPDEFAIGERTSINLQISNTGSSVLSSKSNPPLFVSYHWRRARGFSRFWRGITGSRSSEGVRTTLLIDVAPGRMITQPVIIETPASAGVYVLEISIVLENVRWFPEFALTHQANIVESKKEQKYVQTFAGPALSYTDQHRQGIELLRSWFGRFIEEEHPFTLEIGGNYSPSTEELNRGVIINLDVDLHGLMARNIVKHDNIVSIVANGMDVPFQDRAIDAIVMFATFHHFPDPVLLLRRLGSKVKSGGLICLMCEPIGHVTAAHNYTAYIEELEKGVNEQSFEIWEYVAMIDAAGLEIVDAVFDRGAAMIAARPKPGSGSLQAPA